MEGLRRDLVDLQGVVLSVFCRVGAVRCPSWKFPDKVSCNLDLVALLDRYGFLFAEDDPEFTPQSHVVLLELVIDRLLLLIQSFTQYTENLLGQEVAPPSPLAATGPPTSIGPAVRKYWDRVLRLGTLYQQLATEKKDSPKDDAPSLACSSQAAEAEHKRLPSSCSEPSEVTEFGFPAAPSLTSSAGSRLLCGGSSTQPEAKSARSPDRPIQSITPLQAIPLSLVPCEACEKAQDSLREAGRAIIRICNSQNLPSSLGRFLQMVEETFKNKPLAAVDINYWASEQSKDLSRIDKHIRRLTELVGPLKEELDTSQKQKGELRKQLEALEGRLQKEKEAQEQQRKEAELWFEKRHQKSLQLVARLEKEKEDLQNKQAKTEMLQEAKTDTVDKAELRSREKRMEVLASQLEAAEHQLSQAATKLEKEKAKVESVLRHKESLQAKQRALMQHLDRLDQECEQLKANLVEEEEELFLTKERLKETQQEKRETQRQLEAQQKLTEKMEQEKMSMEQTASELQRRVSELEKTVHQMKERERLLVFFPDLHVPVEAQWESSGDVLEDMGKQLQANSIRISILEKENLRLRSAVARMREVAPQEGPKLLPPTQLQQKPPTQVVGCAICPLTPTPGAQLSRNQSGHSTGSTASQGKLGHRLAKPASGEVARKPLFAFAYEDAPSPRVRGRDKGSAHCTRSHQK